MLELQPNLLNNFLRLNYSKLLKAHGRPIRLIRLKTHVKVDKDIKPATKNCDFPDGSRLQVVLLFYRRDAPQHRSIAISMHYVTAILQIETFILWGFLYVCVVSTRNILVDEVNGLQLQEAIPSCCSFSFRFIPHSGDVGLDDNCVSYAQVGDIETIHLSFWLEGDPRIVAFHKVVGLDGCFREDICLYG